MAKATTKNHKLRNFWIRMVIFILIMMAILAYTVYVLTPKYDYGICSMTNLYSQPENSIDVLAVGTSLTYTDLNTNVLWTEYGIASYNLASAEAPYWVTYYQLKEALKYQKPKVVLLDAKASMYYEEATDGRTILFTYGILDPVNRIKALKECTVDKNFLDFLLAFPVMHSYYMGITTENFSLPPSNEGRGNTWKGFIENTEVEKHERPSFVWTKTKGNIYEREIEFARKIFELCEEENIPIMLIGFPYADYKNDHIFYNTLWAVAGEYGVTGINYNNPDNKFGLRYSSDCADWQHLNVKGSVTFSRQLGTDLKKLYDIPDHRGDDYYKSYDICAELWYGQFPEYLSEAE